MVQRAVAPKVEAALGRLRPSACRVFFNDTATTEIYTLSLHDALPIYVALMQSVLRLPGDFLDLLRHPLLPFAQLRPQARPQPIAPGRFDGDSSQMRVAGFGDAAASGSLAGGLLAGHCTAVTHQLPSALKAGD